MPRRNAPSLDPASWAWPNEADAASDSLEANHCYMPDVRLARWEDVDKVLEREHEVLPLLEVAPDAQAEWESQTERINAQADGVADEFFTSLDPGIASATLALGAAGCIPFWSCNGGAFGGVHSSSVPIVRFFARPALASLLSECAGRAGVALSQDEHGRCAVTANHTSAFRAFALAMREETRV